MKFSPLASVGLLLLVGGVIAFAASSSRIAACESFLGQFGRVFDASLQRECQNWQSIRTAGIVGIVVGGGITIWGFLNGLRAGLDKDKRE